MSPVCLWLSVILSVAVSWQSHTQEHICIPFSNSSTHVFRWHLHAWPRENRVAVTSFSPLMSIWHLDTACLLVFPPMSCFSPLFSTLEKKLFEEGQTLLLPVVPSRVFLSFFKKEKEKTVSQPWFLGHWHTEDTHKCFLFPVQILEPIQEIKVTVKVKEKEKVKTMLMVCASAQVIAFSGGGGGYHNLYALSCGFGSGE